MPALSKEFLDIQATMECGFTLKRVRDITRTYCQMSRFGISTKLHIRWFKLKIKKIKIDKTSYMSRAIDTRHQNCTLKKALFVLPWGDTNTRTKTRGQKRTSQKHPHQKSIWQKRTRQKGARFLLVMMYYFLKSALNKMCQQKSLLITVYWVGMTFNVQNVQIVNKENENLFFDSL